MKRTAGFIATVAALLLLCALVAPVAADGSAAERVLPASVTVNQQFELKIDISGAQFGRVVETLPANFHFVTTDGDAVRCEPISGMPEGGVEGEIIGDGEAKFTFFATSATASSFKYSVTAPSSAVTGAAFSGVLQTGPEEQYDVGGQSTVDVLAAGEPGAPTDGEPDTPAGEEPAVPSDGQATVPPGVTGFTWYIAVIIVLAVAVVATLILVMVRKRRSY